MTLRAVDPTAEDRACATDILRDAIRVVESGDAVAVVVTLYYPGREVDMRWSGIDDLDRLIGALERQKIRLMQSASVPVDT